MVSGFRKESVGVSKPHREQISKLLNQRFDPAYAAAGRLRSPHPIPAWSRGYIHQGWVQPIIELPNP